MCAVNLVQERIWSHILKCLLEKQALRINLKNKETSEMLNNNINNDIGYTNTKKRMKQSVKY